MHKVMVGQAYPGWIFVILGDLDPPKLASDMDETPVA